MWHIVVQIGECNAIFGTNRLANDDLVDVIKLVPIVVAGEERDSVNLLLFKYINWNLPNVVILDKWLKLGSTGNRHIQRFCGEETLRVEQIKEVAVHQIS